MTITSSNNITVNLSMGKWKGNDITVSHSVVECPIQGHALEVMHHYGEDGRHYCPTQFLYCPQCGGIADEPEPYKCNKWGEA